MENSEKDLAPNSSLESSDNALDIPSSDSAETPQSPDSRRLARSRLLLALLVAGLLIVLLTGGFILVLKHKSANQPSKTVIINTQSLDNGTLNKLTSALGKNGEVKQQLTITPSTLFKNDVTIQGAANVQQNLTVGGNLTVKGGTNLLGPVVTGSSLAVNGPLTVGGNTGIGGNLSVSGQISAASLSVGSITLSTINLSGNLSWGGHLIPSGAAPDSKPSVAASGGTVVLSGNDSAGTITITTGNGNVIAGEMAIINFHSRFSLTPKVQLTPVNFGAATLQYFVTQSPGFFTINTASVPAKNTIYDFNYFVTQ